MAKPLIWQKQHADNYSAHMPRLPYFECYKITLRLDNRWQAWSYFRSRNVPGNWETKEQAQEACQRDFDGVIEALTS